MKSHRVFKLLSLLILPFLYAVPTFLTLSAADKRDAEYDIRETVIRRQMEDWIREGDKSEKEAKDEGEKRIAQMLNFKIFFVSINGKDPTDEFLKRFHDLPRTIKRVSDSEISKQYRMAVLDKATGKRGIIFSADNIRWIDEDSVEVEGGYHCDGLCGAGMTFRLKRENGKWMVKSAGMRWIS